MVTPAFTCTKIKVTVGGVIIDVCDSLSMDLEFDGGPENVYGNSSPVHIIGGKKCTFTVRRWFWVGTDPDLFVDLFDGNTPFSINAVKTDDILATITLSNCIAYKYRPVFGAPNDKVGEELTGEGTAWVLA